MFFISQYGKKTKYSLLGMSDFYIQKTRAINEVPFSLLLYKLYEYTRPVIYDKEIVKVVVNYLYLKRKQAIIVVVLAQIEGEGVFHTVVILGVINHVGILQF